MKTHFFVWRGTLIACILMWSSPIWACSALKPNQMLVYEFDHNQDGVLNAQEWTKVQTQAQTSLNSTQFNFKIKEIDDFNLLDHNQDAHLSEDELRVWVRYQQHPCILFPQNVFEWSDNRN